MESVLSDDMNDELCYSDDESNAKKREKRKEKKKKAKINSSHVYRQEIDTNIFSVKMKTLKQDQVEIATGDPIFCENCKIVLNSFSKTQEEAGIIGQKPTSTKQIWTCEFCYKKNKINIEPEEFPQSGEINYILEGPKQNLSGNQKSAADDG